MNLYSDSFTSAVADALQLPEPLRYSINWVSPLANDSYAEYRDGEFLEILGLERFAPQLAEFWPERGPCWDALARVGEGCVLIEAKSHVSEIYGSGCGAGERSLVKINAGLDETKRRLGAPIAANWTGKLYQSANRYAYLYFLREKCSIPAYLLNVYFVADRWTRTSEEQWNEAIREVNAALGLTSPVPFSASLFFDVSDLP